MCLILYGQKPYFYVLIVVSILFSRSIIKGNINMEYKQILKCYMFRESVCDKENFLSVVFFHLTMLKTKVTYHRENFTSIFGTDSAILLLFCVKRLEEFSSIPFRIQDLSCPVYYPRIKMNEWSTHWNSFDELNRHEVKGVDT